MILATLFGVCFFLPVLGVIGVFILEHGVVMLDLGVLFNSSCAFRAIELDFFGVLKPKTSFPVDSDASANCEHLLNTTK